MSVQAECRFCGAEVHAATLSHVREQLRLIELAMTDDEATEDEGEI